MLKNLPKTDLIHVRSVNKLLAICASQQMRFSFVGEEMRGRFWQWCIALSAMLGSAQATATAIVDYPIQGVGSRRDAGLQTAGAGDSAGSLAQGDAGSLAAALLPVQALLRPDGAAPGSPFLRPLVDAMVVHDISFRTAEEMRALGSGARDVFDRSARWVVSSLRQPINWVLVVSDHAEAVALLSVRGATWDTARLACLRRLSGGHGDVRLAPLAVYGWRC
ncbi:hypothetical protein HL653_20515 [Sphingomonas sp. AP4-R1]|uniref:hypothetical protein n=1 Tax=Sphingomonas sp. AP4-R1 TaxID=2735134 RepID=UPI0014939199|nr:hypothetical protein [Sphingomonas sp. AP4-R1]QJU59816.1 hypothetical protein HL653_20515 [Sphingomonas sp. AP4-R1]